MSFVLDTGPIVALLDADDRDHRRCVELLENSNEDLVVPAPVMVEVDYWCRKRLGMEALRVFVDDIESGAYRWFELDAAVMRRASELVIQYRDIDLGYVDAAVVATCEALDEVKVVTLDRRHFSVVRPMHWPNLEILPG